MYLQEYVDGKKSQGGSKTTDMHDRVTEMMNDLKKAHKVREEQLSEATQRFRTQLALTVTRHEQLLVMYRSVKSLI